MPTKTKERALLSLLRNTTPPLLTLENVPDISSANDADYVLSGSCGEEGAAVNIQIGTLNVTPSPICSVRGLYHCGH